jgi:hypothetical protein
MSGPIVRTGTTPKFWANWEQAFGGGKSSEADSKKSKKADDAPKVEKKKSAAKSRK